MYSNYLHNCYVGFKLYIVMIMRMSHLQEACVEAASEAAEPVVLPPSLR